MAKTPKYFMYFPGNYRWSAAFVNMLGRGSYGGADISELHKIGRLLEGKDAEDDEAWFDACVTIADEVRAHAERFRASDHPVSAAALLSARLPLLPDGRALPHAEGREGARRLSHRGRLLPPVRRRSPTSRSRSSRCRSKASSLPGYFVHARRMPSRRARPCVVFFDGLDVTKEIQYVAGVPDLIKRGISVLVMDGPGTGEAIRFRGLVLRHDYEKAGSACIDFLERRARRRPEEDRHRRDQPRRLLRAALRRARTALCRLHRLGRDLGLSRRVEAARRGAVQGVALGAGPPHHVDPGRRQRSSDALKRLEPFKLDGVVQKMRCPFLVVHWRGRRADPARGRAGALRRLRLARTRRLRVFTGEEGGAQHCQRDYLTLGCATMWDWFEDKLVRA